MRSMRAYCELELNQQLVCCRSSSVIGATVLSTDLAELARPVRHNNGLTAICQRIIVGAVRPVLAEAREPTPRELIIGRGVITHRPLKSAGLTASAPDEFGSRDEGSVNRSLERF